jgi:hypothetical protein
MALLWVETGSPVFAKATPRPPAALNRRAMSFADGRENAWHCRVDKEQLQSEDFRAMKRGYSS